MHRRIAARLLNDPEAVIDKALSNLKRWMEMRDGREVIAVMEEWENVLQSRNFEEIAKFIVSEGEHAYRMRQSSPFAGVLSPQEVWAIKRNHEAA